MTEGTSGRLVRLRWPLFPTRRLAALVCLIAPWWLLPAPLGPAIVGLLAVALMSATVADYLRLPGPRDIEVVRRIPDVVGLGDPVEIRYTIASSWNRSVLAELHDLLPPTLTGVSYPIAAAIEPATTRELSVTAIPSARGPQTLERAALRITSPFPGLLVRIVRVDLPGETLVVPSTAMVRRFRLLAMQDRLQHAGVRALRLRGEGRSFSRLRDYVRGDDPRHVDWKATARHRRLITREHTIERSQTVFTMVDCGRSMTQLSHGYPRFEHVLSAAILLTDVASSAGDQVGMLAFDDEVRALVLPQRGAAALTLVRQSLSGLQATMSEPDYAMAFRTLALRQRRRALVVLFSDVLGEEASRAFVAHVSRAARRHSVAVVAIRNEELHAAARPAATGAAALYRAAAAEELVREREAAIARMRQAGVAVLDVAAPEMATGVVNRYLEVKRLGLL